MLHPISDTMFSNGMFGYRRFPWESQASLVSMGISAVDSSHGNLDKKPDQLLMLWRYMKLI